MSTLVNWTLIMSTKCFAKLYFWSIIADIPVQNQKILWIRLLYCSEKYTTKYYIAFSLAFQETVEHWSTPQFIKMLRKQFNMFVSICVCSLQRETTCKCCLNKEFIPPAVIMRRKLCKNWYTQDHLIKVK